MKTGVTHEHWAPLQHGCNHDQYDHAKVRRCKLDPGLKAPGVQTSIVEIATVPFNLSLVYELKLDPGLKKPGVQTLIVEIITVPFNSSLVLTHV